MLEMDPRPKLTPKQEIFAKEYLLDLNATQAAIRAGYSKRTAKSQGQRLLTYVDVAKLIQQGRERREAKLDVKADDVIRELAKIGFANMEDYTRLTESGGLILDATNLTRDQKAAISEVGYDAAGNPKIKLAVKRAALVDLGRHFALFTDRVENSVLVRSITMGFEDPNDDG